MVLKKGFPGASWSSDRKDIMDWCACSRKLEQTIKETRKLDAKMDKNTDSYEIDFLSPKHFLG